MGKTTIIVYFIGIALQSFVSFSGAEAYVLLSSTKATLPVSPNSPTLNFVWDGKSPKISQKDKYEGGAYANLDDIPFMQQLIANAFAVWNNVPGAYIVLAVTESKGPVKLDTTDGVFSIVTEKSANISTAAFANPYVKPDAPNTIADCDISISDTETTAKVLAYTLVHELGHCLGLGHSHTNYNAIMGYARDQSSTLKLGGDDIAGVIFLYPEPDYATGVPKDAVCGVVRRSGQIRPLTLENIVPLSVFILAPLLICHLRVPAVLGHLRHRRRKKCAPELTT